MNFLKTTLLLFAAFTARFVLAQQQAPCSGPEFAQLDFWVGDWDLTWKDSSGQMVNGSNSVRKDHGDCVIHENFMDYSTGFRGESVSVYDLASKQWKQTWVDNKGSYMVFAGSMNNKVMDLRMERKNELYSMIWTNISKDSLDWTWRKSADHGKKWQTLWKIHYKRRVQLTPSFMNPTVPTTAPTGPNGEPAQQTVPQPGNSTPPPPKPSE